MKTRKKTGALSPRQIEGTRKSVGLSHHQISILLRQSRHHPDSGQPTDLAQCDHLCQQFADMLENQGDPLFDRDRFLKACDYEKDN